MGRVKLRKPIGTKPCPPSRLAPVIDRAPLPVVEVQGSAHTLTYVNPLFCQLLGKTRTELIGRPFAEIVPGGRRCVPLLNQVYQTGQPTKFEQEVEAEAQPAQWLYAMWPALDDNERPVGVIIQLAKTANFLQNAAAMNEALLVSALHQHELTAEAVKLNAQLEHEIIERKLVEAALHEANARLGDQSDRLEGVVVERTARLRDMVGELEAFSYSIAHDMRAPLRGMQGFARILLNDHTDRLDTVARNYLEHISSSAARMDLLIQDVLNYTRVSRSDIVLAPVDLDRLTREVISSHPDWQPPQAEIRIEGVLPAVLGHAGLLTQCISNLVSNAVKFVAPGTRPQVRIWAEERPPSAARLPALAAATTPHGALRPDAPAVRIWFEDQGIGIAAKDRDRVFRMFERINPADQFEGTGIGLAIVRKTLDRMGGRVGFESDPPHGSKFWIELAKAASGAGQQAA